jgi:type I restriction enzyme M protein
MSSKANQLVNKLWNFCDVLRDDGVSYGDYVEQLTYLLFLKMDEEMIEIGFQEESQVPEECSWQSLVSKDGEELESHYRAALQELGSEGGLLGIIFGKAQNRIQDPAKLRRLVLMINDENWSGMNVDVKGELYEGLLQKNAEDVKSGAGQYFTPRPLIRGIVEAVQPEPDQTICDPACGTGGFFLAAHDYITDPDNYQLDKQQKQFLQQDAFKGWEIVDNTARLCVMNLYLHGIHGEETPIIVDDSLRSDPGDRYDLILTNPPFGKKASVTILSSDGEVTKESLTYERDDFWATTSNKQVNFLQHVSTILKIGGTAAIVVPDNVLFEGGAGETVRRKLLDEFDVHTLLRLPSGIFYATGVKANVLFFDAKPAQANPWTDDLWIYDLRTNKHFTLKRDPLTYNDLTEFIDCYNPDNRHEREETERFKSFPYEDLIKRDKVNLDIFWLKDDSLEDIDNLPSPEVLASEITENLEAAVDLFSQIQDDLRN